MTSDYPISIVNYLDSSVEKGIDEDVKHAMSILRKKHVILLEEPTDETELFASLEKIKANGKGILFITCHSNLTDGIARTEDRGGFIDWQELVGKIPDSDIIFLASCSSQHGGALLHETFKDKYAFVPVISTDDEVSTQHNIKLIDLVLDTMYDPENEIYSTASFWKLIEELNQKLLKEKNPLQFVIDPKDEPTC